MLTRNRTLLAVAAVLLGAVPAIALADQPLPAEGDEDALIAVLQKADAPVFDKAKACQALAVIGTKKCVPVLAGMLDDDKLAHYARFGLEPIPDPSVDEALRDALGKLEGMRLVGVINSIGNRRDTQAAEALCRLAGKLDDKRVAAAACAAAGRIASPPCLSMLKEGLEEAGDLRPAVGDASLTACDMLLAGGKREEAIALYDAVLEAEMPRHVMLAAAEGWLRASGAEGATRFVEYLRSDDKGLFRAALGAAPHMPRAAVAEAIVAELDEMKTSPAPTGKLLSLVKAEYGAKDKSVDVTDKLRAMIENNRLSFTAGNQLAGDPAPGVVKTLKLTYRLGEEEKTVVVPENEDLTLAGDALPEHPRQVVMITVLGDLGAREALPAVLKLAKAGPLDVRLAAIRALASLGDASAAGVLMEAALRGEAGLGDAARDSLAALEGEAVDSAILAALEETKGEARTVVIDLIGRRGIAAAVPALLEAANSDEEHLRHAALAALGTTVGLDNLDALIARLLEPRSEEDLPVVREALARALLRMPDRNAAAARLLGFLPQASDEARSALLDMVGTVGGEKALAGVSAAARSSDDALQDAATRVLGEWMSTDAGPVLLELARTLDSEKYRTRALRGYIRLARQFSMPSDDRAAMCRKALAQAWRDEERKLVFEVLVRYASPETLAVATDDLDGPMKDQAVACALEIAGKIVRRNPAPVAEAMKKVIAATDDKKQQNQAKRLLGRAGG